MKYQNDLLYYLRELRSRLAYEPLPIAIERSSRDSKTGSAIRSVYKQYLLGLSRFSLTTADRQTRLLASILWFSMLNGLKPLDLLDFMANKIEKDSSFANRLKARIGSNKIVSAVGIVYFFPMFAGISLSLLQTTSSFSGVFTFALLAYPFVMLFVEQALNSIDKPIKNVFLGILPYYAVSIAVFMLARLLANIML